MHFLSLCHLLILLHFTTEKKFRPYGKIDGIDINANGFAFVQFAKVEDAKRACNAENGSSLKGRKLEVRMFDKSGGPNKNKGKFGPRDRERDRSPFERNRGNNIEPFMSGAFHPHQGPPPNMNLPPHHQAPIPPPHPFTSGHQMQPGAYGPGIGITGPGHHQQNTSMANLPPQAPPPPPQVAPGSVPVNDIEIIVINKDQWAYAEMVERRLRSETDIKLIDILFLHSPQLIQMTLSDLFERRTLYALVVSPENESHKSVTVHMLHNQMEYRNVPLEKAIGMIADDFRKYNQYGGDMRSANNVVQGGAPSGVPQFDRSLDHNRGHSLSDRLGPPPNSVVTRNGSNVQMNSVGTPGGPFGSNANAVPNQIEKRLPDEISYLLQTTISEGGVQFLSLQQIDTVIDYFTRERDRLTSRPNLVGLDGSSLNQPGQGPGGANSGQVSQSSQANSVVGGGNNETSAAASLFENPQVKEALKSLLSIGALGSQHQSNPQQQQQQQQVSAMSAGNIPPPNHAYQSSDSVSPLKSNGDRYGSSSYGPAAAAQGMMRRPPGSEPPMSQLGSRLGGYGAPGGRF